MPQIARAGGLPSFNQLLSASTGETRVARIAEMKQAASVTSWVSFFAGSLVTDKHDLDVVGYWVPEDAPASDNTFIYLLAHPSREQAKKNFDAMRADPAFQEMVKSEQAEKLVEKVDSTYMHPTDFSAMK